MSNMIGIRLDDETDALLTIYMEKNGFKSKGLAVKHIVEERLAADAEYDHLEPLIARIEERVARVSSRGTKASLAALCLLSAKEDSGMAAKLDSMSSGKVFSYAWDMGGALMTHGERPDFYKAAKHSSLMRARERTDEEKFLGIVAEIDDARMAIALDDIDILPWFDAMNSYREVRDLIESSPEESSDEWLRAFRTYTEAKETLLSLLGKMYVWESEIDSLLRDEDMAFAHKRGWFDMSEDPIEMARRRRRARGLSDGTN